jgi:DNA sulfur modification protein DndD
MWIERVELIEWKQYREARFDFPRPGRDKKIVVIGGQNGRGKTSLLEAMVVCLYGRLSLPWLTDRPNQDGTGYRRFLTASFNKNAGASRMRLARITMGLRDENRAYKVSRTFHFREEQGEVRWSSEELTISEGAARASLDELELVDFGRGDGRDVETTQAAFINTKILPYSFADFFFFDGERIRQLAEQDLQQTVTERLDNLFGIGLLRLLTKDLKIKAAEIRTRARSTVGKDTEKVYKLQADLMVLEGRVDELGREIPEIDTRVERATRQMEKLQSDLFAITRGENVERGALEEQIKAVDALIRAKREELNARVLERAVQIGMVAQLREALVVRLDDEAEVLAARQQAERLEPQLVKFKLELAGIASPFLQPPLTSDQESTLHARIEAAYRRSHISPWIDTKRRLRHDWMGTDQRRRVHERVRREEALSVESLRTLLEDKKGLEDKRRSLDDRRILCGDGERVRDLVAKIRTLEGEIRLDLAQLKRNGNEKQSAEAKLGELRRQLTDALANEQIADDQKRLAEHAEAYVDVVDSFAEMMRARRTDALAAAMTSAVRRMHHKADLVHDVQIQDGRIELYSKDGKNLGDRKLSAGENQILALALLDGAARVSGRKFSRIIDTPVARLDTEHRDRVVQEWKACDGQVVLLSTNTEIVGSLRSAIESKVSRWFYLEYNDSETTVLPDHYFAEAKS